MTDEFEKARFSSSEKLSGKLDELGQGRDIKSLEPFAKAYLGMYLDLDPALLPEQRVALVAGDEVITSVWDGFESVFQYADQFSPEMIGQRYAADERIAEGYIALAAIDRVIDQSPVDISALQVSDDTYAALICFHYVDRNELPNQWIEYLIQHRPALFANVMLDFWCAIQQNQCERYPGLREILFKQEYEKVLSHIALPVLKNIRRIHKKLLPRLLLTSLRYVPHEDLLPVCQQRLDQAGRSSVTVRTYWICTAYLLSPQSYLHRLTEYVGRTREKAVPMLAYVEYILRHNDHACLKIDARMLADLLSMLAPKFRPVRDQFGRLDDNVSKIVWLFDLLSQQDSESVAIQVRRLRDIRVMKLYSDYLQKLEQQLADKKNGN